MRKRFFIVIFILCALFSCSKRKGEETPPPVPGSQNQSPQETRSGPPDAAGQENRTISLQQTEESDSGGTQRQSSQNQQRTASSQTEALFSPYLPETPVQPEDMIIGPLQDLTADGETNPLVSIAGEFLDGLIAGKIREDLILADEQAAFKRSLSYPLSLHHLPVRYRLGEIRISDDSARGNIRLYGNPGRTVGEILFRKNGEGEWRLSDFTANLSLLSEPYEEREEPYEPSEYSWIGQ